VHKTQAEDMLAKLERKQRQTRLRAQDDAAYEAAKRAGTASALKQYISSCEVTGCVHGPQAKHLLARLKSAGQRQELRAEDDAAYGRAQRLGTETAIKSYLSTCTTTGCVHKAQAEDMLANMQHEQRQKRLRAEDDAAYEAAKQAGTASALHQYLSSCEATGCVHGSQVKGVLAWLQSVREKQELRAEDDAAYEQAQRLGTEVAIKSYLSTCAMTGCVHKAKAEHVLAKLEREQQLKEETERRRTEELTQQQALEHQRQATIAKIPQPEMVAIPGGSFLMGDLSGRTDSNEKPVHKVTIKPFLMSKYEVTFEQYDAFVKATGRKKPGDEGWGRGKRPVINVSWVDAVAYARWLSAETNKRYRLPTESEWEYAARAGSSTVYHFGDGSSKLCQYGNWEPDVIGFLEVGPACDDGFSNQTAPVGTFKQNQFGLYDMHGNVWEWTHDCWNNSYLGAPTNGSAWGSGDCEQSVVRGGSWAAKQGFILGSASRFHFRQATTDRVVGFRLARDR
jgi:formylglycine-generating enzyme required for sulfatase activity